MSGCTRDFADRAPSVVFRRGRVCLHRGCATTLSMYNPLPYCAVHRHDADEPEPEPAEERTEFGDPEQTRTCTRCGTTHPATLEFFPMDRSGWLGLHIYCKACKRDISRKDMAKRRAQKTIGTNEPTYDETPKTCTKCGRVKPRTVEYWAPDRGCKDGLHPWCKTCKHQKRHAVVVEYPHGRIGVSEVTR